MSAAYLMRKMQKRGGRSRNYLAIQEQMYDRFSEDTTKRIRALGVPEFKLTGKKRKLL